MLAMSMVAEGRRVKMLVTDGHDIGDGGGGEDEDGGD